MLGYATIYTCLPVFCLIFDEDIQKNKVLDYPLFIKVYRKIEKWAQKISLYGSGSLYIKVVLSCLWRIYYSHIHFWIL